LDSIDGMEEIRVVRDGQVASLVIDRPGSRNAMTQDMWAAVPGLIDSLRHDPGIRLLTVMSASPGVFCAGADVVEYRDNAGDVDWGNQSQGRVEAALRSIRSFEAPTLAVIDGACIGGGSGIALSCDLRISSTRGVFGIPPAKLGLVFPIEDTVELVRLVGPSATKRILFTGARFDADDALAIGFLDAVCSPEELEAVVTRWTDDLVSAAPGSVRAMKRIISLVQDGLVRGNDETRQLVDAALSGTEHREGVTAFLERRPPRFTG
jgi:enoyl-CoA hydratase/carnithine racemase